MIFVKTYDRYFGSYTHKYENWTAANRLFAALFKLRMIKELLDIPNVFLVPEECCHDTETYNVGLCL